MLGPEPSNIESARLLYASVRGWLSVLQSFAAILEVDVGLLPLGKGAGKGKKGKAKGQAKAIKKGFRQPALSVTATTSASAKPPLASGASVLPDMMSVAGSSGTRVQNQTQQQSKKAKDWVSVLDLKTILAGEPLGRDIWGAERTLEAMEKKGNVGHEFICLKSHVALAKLARDLFGSRALGGGLASNLRLQDQRTDGQFPFSYLWCL